jgi:hypothetical protein
MLLDFDVQRCTRRCAATDRDLQPGDTCYSVLEVQGAEVVRKDYCGQAWTAAPDSAIGWWKWRVPKPTERKIKLAPNDVLLELFIELADRPEQQDLRYVLLLLLIRRRVLRLEIQAEPLGIPIPQCESEVAAKRIVAYCPKRDATFEVAVCMPDPQRIDQIQQQLSELLVAGTE